MFKVRRGLLDGTEERYGLMSSSMRGMSSTRRKIIRDWQKLFRLKLGRHMFLALMVLVFMCVLTKFVLLNMFSDQLTLDPEIHANLVKHYVPSPNNSPVYNNLSYVIFYPIFFIVFSFSWILYKSPAKAFCFYVLLSLPLTSYNHEMDIMGIVLVGFIESLPIMYSVVCLFFLGYLGSLVAWFLNVYHYTFFFFCLLSIESYNYTKSIFSHKSHM